MQNNSFLEKAFAKNIQEADTYIRTIQKKPVCWQRLVVAYSGGVDSTLLLHYANQYAKQHALAIHAIHTNHGITFGTPTLSWQKHCMYHCRMHGIPLTVKKLYIEQKGNKEHNARIARYHAFKECCKSSDLLLLGHHLDDAFENFLLRIQRGGGLHALLTPQIRKIAKNGAYMLRPFWQIPKTTVIADAKRLGLDWVEDPGNYPYKHRNTNINSGSKKTPVTQHRAALLSSSTYQTSCKTNARANVRGLIVPGFDAIQSNWRKGWLACQQTLHAEHNTLCYLLDKEIYTMLDNKGLCIAKLIQQPPFVQRQLINRWLTLCACITLGQKNLMHHLPRLCSPEGSLPTIPIQAKCDNVHIANTHATYKASLPRRNIVLTSYADRMWLYDTVRLACAYTNIYGDPYTKDTITSQDNTMIQLSQTWQTTLPWCSACGILSSQTKKNIAEELTICFHRTNAKIRIAGRSHHSKLRNIWQTIRLPTWERALTPHVYKNGLLIAVGEKLLVKEEIHLSLQWQPMWRVYPQ